MLGGWAGLRKHPLRLAAAVGVVGLYVFNASWRVPSGEQQWKLIAHRGVHQTFHRQDLTRETCTAQRMDPPTHAYLENTLPSMAAAFAAGADIVELDVHPTQDGHLAVFHDWTVDCRTEGRGETRSHPLAYLKKLDVGYGYTADGGKSFPLRGQGVGQMPEFKEVLQAFPQGQFLVNFKSREAREGDMLAAVLAAHPEWRTAVWGAYGGDEPTFRAKELIPAPLQVWSRRGLVKCLGGYLALGWTGWMPKACHATQVMVPLNVAPWMWGWPKLFQHRVQAVGSEVILLGPVGAGEPGTVGIDTLPQLAQVPPSFSGYLWTNKIEVIGPAVKALSKTQ